MRAARRAAFLAPSTPTHATGMPGGICTIESSASSPSRTLLDDRNGTPTTGRSVCAATTPGSAAASPAPAITTFRPRRRALRAYSATASGCRCAERTSNSYPIPRAASSSRAGCMRSRSDSEPTRTPTTGPSVDDTHPALQRDVGPVAHAREGDERTGRVGALARFRQRRAHGSDVQDPAPVRHEPVASQRGPGVEDERSRRLGVIDAVDRHAGVVAAGGVVGAGEDDRHGGLPCGRELGVGEVAAGGRLERREEVALDQWNDDLRLRIAETTVEFEHARPVFGEHETRIKAADERRAPA